MLGRLGGERETKGRKESSLLDGYPDYRKLGGWVSDTRPKKKLWG